MPRGTLKVTALNENGKGGCQSRDKGAQVKNKVTENKGMAKSNMEVIDNVNKTKGRRLKVTEDVISDPITPPRVKVRVTNSSSKTPEKKKLNTSKFKSDTVINVDSEIALKQPRMSRNSSSTKIQAARHLRKRN